MEEALLVDGFSNAFEALKGGKLLQMYRGDICHRVVAMLGSGGFSVPHGEVKCLEDVICVYGTSPLPALYELTIDSVGG